MQELRTDRLHVKWTFADISSNIIVGIQEHSTLINPASP